MTETFSLSSRATRIVASDFLYPRPSFLAGVASAIDLFGVFRRYNRSSTTTEADARALYSDWRVAGEDLWTAMKGWENPQQERLFEVE
jgi:hypothetical protein